MILLCQHTTKPSHTCVCTAPCWHRCATPSFKKNNVIFLCTWRSRMNCGNLWIGFIIRPYKVILSLLASWRCCAGEDVAVKVLAQCRFYKYATILKARRTFVTQTQLSNLKEFQEARFRSTGLSHHCHCSAEVVHILTVGIQHHGLWKLLRNTLISSCWRDGV